jgi:hypothetical protein
MKKLIYTLCIICFCDCTKWTAAPPPTTSISSATVYSSDATAIAAVTSLYTTMAASSVMAPGSINALSLWCALSSDEMGYWSGMSNLAAWAYYRNELSAVIGGAGSEFYDSLYSAVYTCNATIQGLSAATGLTPAVRQQLLGEAKFVRALCYFYLVNLYGEVPMPLTMNTQVNASLARSTVAQVYRQILADLQDAAANLSLVFLDSTLLNPDMERVRPTRWAALALLARTDLYTGDWAGAENAADTVIANSSLFQLGTLSTVFLKASLNNNEAIWQLQPVNEGWNSEDAKAFIMPANGPGGNGYNMGVYMSAGLLAAFEPGDLRRISWVDSTIVDTLTFYYPYKYKVNTYGAPVTEYPTLLRLGELYLIRAEARAHLNELSGAAADLNMIRARAGLGPTGAGTQQELLQAIQHERRVELFTEGGQRWLDLKRTAAVDSVLSVITPQKGGIWNSYQQLYPIPLADITVDPNLSQNEGY